MTPKKRIRTYQKTIECQIYEDSTERGSCMEIPYPLPFEITCLKLLLVEKYILCF